MRRDDCDEESSDSPTAMDRRDLLATTAGAGMLALAGCQGEDTDAPAGTSEPPARTGESTTPTTEAGLEPQHLTVLNLNRTSYFETVLFTALQGLANRDTAEIFLDYGNKKDESWFEVPNDEQYNVWLDWYQRYDHVETTRYDDPYEIFTALETLPARGYAVIDPHETETVNVAATYAGTEDLLPVTPALMNRPDTPDLPVKRDTRPDGNVRDGGFRDLTRLETYEWVYEHLWPATNQDVVCNLHVPPPEEKPGVDITSFTADTDTIYVKFEDSVPDDDHRGARLQTMTVWRDGSQITQVAPFSPEEVRNLVVDENTQRMRRTGKQRYVSGDGYWVYEIDGVRGADTIGMNVRDQYRVSVATSEDGPWTTVATNTEPEVIHQVGPPILNNINTGGRIRDHAIAEGGCFFNLASTDAFAGERDLKERYYEDMPEQGLVLGWRTPRGNEFTLIKQASRHGLLVPGASTHSGNFSLHSRIEVGDAVERFREEALSPAETPPLEEKIYLTFVLSDGDSLNFLTRRGQGGQWLYDDHHANERGWAEYGVEAVRGELDFGWAVPPTFPDLAPGILDYFAQTATPTDHFVVGPSGLGYFYPTHMDRDVLGRMLEGTADAMEELGLGTIAVLNPFDQLTATDRQQFHDVVGDTTTGAIEVFNPPSVQGQVWGDVEVDPGESATIDHGQSMGWSGRGKGIDVEYLEQLADRRTGRPLFVPLYIGGHNIDLATVKARVDELDDAFEVVGPDAFFTLYAAARDDDDVVAPPERNVPFGEETVLTAGETNLVGTTIRGFFETETSVTVEAVLDADGFAEPITRSQVHAVAGDTANADFTVDVPSHAAGSRGEIRYLVDGVEHVSRPVVIREPKTEWVYEAEAANHRNGRRVEDPDAENGVAWQAIAGEDGPDGSGAPNHVVWLPTKDQGKGTYVARFRLKVADRVEGEIALLDVVENVPGGPPDQSVAFPRRQLTGSDFETAGEYQYIDVPFDVPITDAPASRSQRQYRVLYQGNATLTVDHIVVQRREN